MSVLIKIKQTLQKNAFGKKIITLYHYLVAVPISKFRMLKFHLIKKSRVFEELKQVQFIENEKLFNKLRDEHISLVRFGDGEISWIYMESKGYFGQVNSKELSEKLRTVLKNPTSRTIIAVPNFFDKFDDFSKSRINSRNIHLSKYATRWLELLDRNYLYGDALVTRVYNGKLNSNFNNEFENWKSVWKDRNVIIIEGKNTRFGIGNDLLSGARSVKRVLAPAENAFSKYSELLDYIKKLNKDALFLVALGPTATVLAYELSELYGMQSIDIGHLDIEYEWFLKNAQKAIPVRGKYVNESGGTSLEELENDVLRKYVSEVIIDLS
ncbi:GT-D fold domain-containing glycosyltransferase [Streptococcus suis]